MAVRSAAERGRDFEDEVAKLLLAAGFEVKANAKTAWPRQTDLFARVDGIELLVEVKSKHRKIDVNDVDSLRSRLTRTPGDIVGAIFATSGLTKGAIQAIEADRKREVLAFVGAEVEALRGGRKSLHTLIERKRTALRTHGKVWLGAAEHSEFVGVALPSGSAEFRLGDVKQLCFESKGGFSGAFYTLEISDPGWGLMGGEGARLSIRPPLHSTSDLRNIVGYLHEKFGLSHNGTFAIYQSESSWYGVGLESFLNVAEEWKRRYAISQSEKFHNSEELVYFDQFRNGWIELSTQRRIDWNSKSPGFLYNSGLVIQLPGVPVDVSPYIKLCRYTGDHLATFEYIGKRWTAGFRLSRPINLEVIGTIINKEKFPDADTMEQERMVMGIIARNPFYRRKSLPKELMDSRLGPLHELRETELLMCSLRDWHDDHDEVDHYLLEGFEITTGDVTRIVRPYGTWDRILKRNRPER